MSEQKVEERQVWHIYGDNWLVIGTGLRKDVWIVEANGVALRHFLERDILKEGRLVFNADGSVPSRGNIEQVEAPCSALDRFTLDPGSGFVFDRDADEWLTTAEEVFDAMSPLLPNAEVSE